MGFFKRRPNPTIRTGYRKTDQHLDVVMAELAAAAQAGRSTHAVSIGWNECVRTPAATVPLYISQLQQAGHEIVTVNTPESAPATLIVRPNGVTAQREASEPSVTGVPTPIKMIAAFGTGWLYAVHEDNLWRSRYIYSDDAPDVDLREYSSFQALCINEGREHAQTMGSLGIIPTEMHKDFATAFHAAM
jgi:hypothetical protein